MPCVFTMETQTKTILIACCAIAMFAKCVICVEISSKIELDSDENDETLTTLAFDTNVNKSFADPSNTSKQPVFTWHHESGLVKPSEPRKRRIYTLHDDLPNQPKVINNIQIVVNHNDSMSNVNSCKHGICGVSVSSKPDGKGNIVTEVHLNIITNTKPNMQIDDIPVIDGVRGVREDQNKQRTFHSISTPVLHSQLHLNNIPQIQSDHQELGESWYQHRRTFQRPHVYRDYRLSGDSGNVGFRGHGTWSRDRPMVSDKIEPPLSRTKSSNDIKARS